MKLNLIMKERFLHKGKSYLTTKGKRADRFPVTTDKKKPADKKLNIFQLNLAVKS